MNNIKYFMLIPEEKSDSPYYNEYFTYIEKDYSKFKDLLEDLGIDYSNQYKNWSSEQIDQRIKLMKKSFSKRKRLF